METVTINGGSSSVKFAVFSDGEVPKRLLAGQIERIGLSGTTLSATNLHDGRIEKAALDASDHAQAASHLADWLTARVEKIGALGHRVVHGGTRLVEHQRVTDELLAELRRAQPLDLAHLPREIALIEGFRRRFPDTPQIACFDTAFHRNLPRLAQLLPIPRHFDAAGIRRLGFHGLSYAYLMSQFPSSSGRIILAHLGSGASMAAVRDARPVDTSMAFTPTAGLVMGTRPGDIDPGLLVYMMRALKMTPEQMDELISHDCGLRGISQTTYDLRDLLLRRATDERAAEAVGLFCYQAKKFIGAYAAALGGLDQLVFSAGIGEHAAEVRAEICDGLQFLGIRLDPQRNAASATVISAGNSAVTVRVIPTDEELMIAQIVRNVLNAAPPP